MLFRSECVSVALGDLLPLGERDTLTDTLAGALLLELSDDVALALGERDELPDDAREPVTICDALALDARVALADALRLAL